MLNISFLIVDDSTFIRAAVRSVIESRFSPKQIIEATNGNEAIEKLKTNEVDIIISDWNMPDLSGDELLYEVRNHNDWRDIPFIMLTSNSNKDFLVTAIQLGVSQYILKPFTPPELEDKILKSWNALNKRRADRYSRIPKHNLIIKKQGNSILGEVVNISRTGILIRLKYQDSIKLFDNYEIEMEVENDNAHNTWNINGINGDIIRLEAEEPVYSNSFMCLAALTFKLGWTKEMEEKLIDFLRWLAAREPNVIEDK